ncbi:MAG TPA: polymer-forming cytoskeletal protein, partial [Pyrinomonadaceae bacterium]|nr:polymer-forming cytoskeletal protein [Pyrinomonadaceae bacterium]
KDQPGEHPAEQSPAYGSTPPPSPGADTSRSATNTPDTSTGARNTMSSDAQANTARAYSESESLARDIKEGTLSGFVGNGTTLTGEANFKGMLRVDGHLSGRVSSQDGTLIISSGGQVDADIEVSVAQIYGTVNGDIIASKRIELGRVARVTGNVQTPALVIEQGAIFEGSCRMQQLRDAQAQEEKRGSGSSATTSSAAATGSSGSAASGAAKPDAAKPGDKPADTTNGQTAASKPATVIS